MTGENDCPCKWCGEPSGDPPSAVGGMECNGCWEVTSRLARFMSSTGGRKEVLRLLARESGEELRPPEDIGQDVMDYIQHHHGDPIKVVANAIRKDRALR